MVQRFLKSINHLKNYQVFGGSFIKPNDSLKLFPPPNTWINVIFYFIFKYFTMQKYNLKKKSSKKKPKSFKTL